MSLTRVKFSYHVDKEKKDSLLQLYCNKRSLSKIFKTLSNYLKINFIIRTAHLRDKED